MTKKPTLVERLDPIQQANRPASFLVGVYRKFGDDRAGRLAAVIAYYGFFSVFPALLALVTILGFVLQNNQSLREDIQEGVIGQLPVIGDYVSDAARQPVTGNTVALVIGVVTALWAGMAAMQASQDAMNIIWDVPRRDDPSFFAKRARSLLMLIVLGGLLIGGSLLTQIVSNVGGVNVITRAVLFLGTLALNIATFLVGYRVLMAVTRPSARLPARGDRRRGRVPDPATRRPAVRQPRAEGRAGRVRNVRHGHRPAVVAVPAGPELRGRRRDQRRRRQPALAPLPHEEARAAHPHRISVGFWYLEVPETDRERWIGQRDWMAWIRAGSTLCTSPTMPRSATPKIGASLSLLIAMMFLAPFMPTMCWVAPEMPTAM